MIDYCPRQGQVNAIVEVSGVRRVVGRLGISGMRRLSYRRATLEALRLATMTTPSTPHRATRAGRQIKAAGETAQGQWHSVDSAFSSSASRPFGFGPCLRRMSGRPHSRSSFDVAAQPALPEVAGALFARVGMAHIASVRGRQGAPRPQLSPPRIARPARNRGLQAVARASP